MAQQYQPNLTTFKVSNKKPEKVAGYDSNSRTLSTEEAISKLQKECGSILNFRMSSRVDKNSYGNLEKKEIIQGSQLSTNTHLAGHGLISLVIQAWENHHKLTLRPDDIWTALMVQFSFYVNANAETLRSSFVSHEGKKNLAIEVDLSQVKMNMGSIVDQFTQMIDNNLVDGEVKDWVIPNFSTTTKEDKLVCGSVLMATMKSYFNYILYAGCGIPSISLDGTIDDWQNIKNRVNKFRRYNLNEWADMLEAILEQFVQAKKGNLDIAFWGKICHWEGGDLYRIPELSGWITAFCAFDKDGKWQGELKEGQDWPVVHYNGADGYVTVDIVLMDFETQYNYNTTLYAGHVGHEIVDNGFGLKPKVGWMLALVGQRKMTVADRNVINPSKSVVSHLKRKNEVKGSAYLKRKYEVKGRAEIDESSTMKPTKRRRRTELDFLLNK